MRVQEVRGDKVSRVTGEKRLPRKTGYTEAWKGVASRRGKRRSGKGAEGETSRSDRQMKQPSQRFRDYSLGQKGPGGQLKVPLSIIKVQDGARRAGWHPRPGHCRG